MRRFGLRSANFAVVKFTLGGSASRPIEIEINKHDLVFALLPHGPRQPFAPRVVGLGRHRSNARRFVLLPVAPLAGLATVVGHLTLQATTQGRAPALLLAEEAAEQVHPQNGTLFGARFLTLAELFTAGVLVVFRRRDLVTWTWTEV